MSARARTVTFDPFEIETIVVLLKNEAATLARVAAKPELSGTGGASIAAFMRDVAMSALEKIEEAKTHDA